MQGKKKNKLDFNDCITAGNRHCIFSSLYGGYHCI